MLGDRRSLGRAAGRSGQDGCRTSQTQTWKASYFVRSVAADAQPALQPQNRRRRQTDVKDHFECTTCTLPTNGPIGFLAVPNECRRLATEERLDGDDIGGANVQMLSEQPLKTEVCPDALDGTAIRASPT